VISDNTGDTDQENAKSFREQYQQLSTVITLTKDYAIVVTKLKTSPDDKQLLDRRDD
jgi:hypothetical protein